MIVRRRKIRRVEGHATRLHSPAIGAAGEVIRYGHWGRPVLVFPAERGSGGRLRRPRHGGGGRPVDRGRPGQALLRRRLRRGRRGRPTTCRWRSGPAGTARTSRGCSTRSYRTLWTTAAAPPTSRRPAPRWGRSTPSTSPSAGPTCFRWPSACPATTTRATGTAGVNAATPLYFNNPTDYVANLHGDHLDWLRGRLTVGAGLRAGPVGGHDRVARVDLPDGPAAGGQGHPARAGPLGTGHAA